MPRIDFTSHRLHVDAVLGAGAQIALDRAQANYLLNVLRLKEGAILLVFNGRDGEWRAAIQPNGRKSALLRVGEQVRVQPAPGSLHFLFAPLKHARLDYMAQKAVEMGASVLRPVLTRRTQAARINLERMRANVIEAAEQCGILHLARVEPEVTLEALLAGWPQRRWLVFCDEDVDVADPLAALQVVRGTLDIGVLVGPEGGFDDAERRAILALPQVVRLSLGPRILRADTAAVAALALVQAVAGF